MKKSSRGNGDRSFQSNGKGDKSRISDVKTYRENWDRINWNKPTRRKGIFYERP